MSKRKKNLTLVAVGSKDFARRMSAAVIALNSDKESAHTLAVGNTSEVRTLALTTRPHLLLIEIGLASKAQDIGWLREVLQDLHSREGEQMHTALAVTTPSVFALAGNLLFNDESSLEPSKLVHNFLVAPPAGIPQALSIEGQVGDLIQHLEELYSETEPLIVPALLEDAWVPTLCDPLSRAAWMRWLPRYARYTKENPLIVGPTGTGKTRMAAALHVLSRREGPFVSITPRDFSSMELVQAELFGAVAGAYTGAVDKWGLVRKAEGGTLFIDELQSIGPELQGKLITFIENKSYRRVGGAESHTADVRFIFATNRPLEELVASGSLRDDFAYRLERLQLDLPPLDQRRLDIGAGLCLSLAKVQRERLVENALNTISSLGIQGISTEAYRKLFAGSWPGNLRQLENTAARLVELASINNETQIGEATAIEALRTLLGSQEIDSQDILTLAAQRTAQRAQEYGFNSLSDCATELQIEARKLALEYCGGDVEQASLLLDESPSIMEFASHMKED